MFSLKWSLVAGDLHCFITPKWGDGGNHAPTLRFSALFPLSPVAWHWVSHLQCLREVMVATSPLPSCLSPSLLCCMALNISSTLRCLSGVMVATVSLLSGLRPLFSQNQHYSQVHLGTFSRIDHTAEHRTSLLTVKPSQIKQILGKF